MYGIVYVSVYTIRKRKRYTTFLNARVFKYSLATFGVCNGAGFAAGVFGRLTCEVATFPGTWDCWDNTLRNCYFRECGLFGGGLIGRRR